MATIMVTPGNVVRMSGTYQHFCCKVGDIALMQGHIAPPTCCPGDVWVLVEATLHKRS